MGQRASSRKQNLKIPSGFHGNLVIDVWDGHRQPRTFGTDIGIWINCGRSAFISSAIIIASGPALGATRP